MKKLLGMVAACFALMQFLPARAGANEDLETARKLEQQAIPMPHGKERLAVILQAAEQLQKVFDNASFDRSSCTDTAANIAQLYQDEDKLADSLRWSETVVKFSPQDWRSWAKIVQCAQTLGDTKKRDSARERLVELNNKHLVDQSLFCREQFSIEGKHVMVLEYFTPKKPNNVRLSFVVLGPSGKTVLTRYALGETEADTAFARESKNIGPDDHIYSLDGYAGNGEWLVSMFKPTFPEYETVRSAVIADVNRRAQPNPKPPNASLKY